MNIKPSRKEFKMSNKPNAFTKVIASILVASLVLSVLVALVAVFVTTN